MQRNRLAPPAHSFSLTIRLVLAGLAGLGFGLVFWLVTAGTAGAAERPELQGRALIASAGWHSRAVRNTVETTKLAKSERTPAGWSAGAVRRGDGRAGRDGSQRVKELQRRLRSLGYRPGPVNGVFGKRTQAAVGWFQHKHQLPLTGVVTVGTLRHIRAAQAEARGAERQGEARQVEAGPDAAAQAAPQRAADAPAPAADTTPAAASDAGFAGLSWWLWGAIAAAALVLLALIAAMMRRRRRDRGGDDTAPVYELWVHGASPDPAIGAFRGVVKAVSVPDEPRPAGWVADSQYLIQDPAKPEPFWAPAEQIDELGAARQQPPAHPADAESSPVATGYLSGQANGPTPSPQAGAIEAACQERGWRLAQIAHDPPGAGGADARPGLQHALHRLASGQASCLVIARLAHVGPSVEDLAQVLARVEECRARLVVCDIDLDTSTTVGRRTANALATLNDPDSSSTALRALPSSAPAPAHH
jgi:peptidoglycan hydrolase-like protein with peptidoglycan-binding domain